MNERPENNPMVSGAPDGRYVGEESQGEYAIRLQEEINAKS